jgi:hypothetical protein
VVTRIIVTGLSFFRSAGSTADMTVFIGLFARVRNTTVPQCSTDETTHLAGDGLNLKQFGVNVTVPPHLIAEYNYVCDCLRYTSISRKPIDLFKLHFKSVWINIFTLAELASIIAIVYGLNSGSSTAAGFIIITAFWVLIYFYVNIHMLWNASRDYWFFTVNYQRVYEISGRMNTFFEVTHSEFDAIFAKRENVEGVLLDYTSAKFNILVYENRWIRHNNYLTQILAFHRFLLYAVSLMFFSVAKNYTFTLLQVTVYNLIGLYILIRIIFYCCCNK